MKIGRTVTPAERNVYANLGFLRFAVSELRSCTGRTDGLTDGQAVSVMRRISTAV